jgi:hypothetical protein
MAKSQSSGSGGCEGQVQEDSPPGVQVDKQSVRVRVGR